MPTDMTLWYFNPFAVQKNLKKYNIKSAGLLGGTLHFSTMLGGHGVVDDGQKLRYAAQAPASRRPASPFPNEANAIDGGVWNIAVEGLWCIHRYRNRGWIAGLGDRTEGHNGSERAITFYYVIVRSKTLHLSANTSLCEPLHLEPTPAARAPSLPRTILATLSDDFTTLTPPPPPPQMP